MGVYVVSAYAASRFQGAVWAGVIGLEQFMHYVYFVLGTLAVKYLRGEYLHFGKQTGNWLLGGGNHYSLIDVPLFAEGKRCGLSV